MRILSVSCLIGVLSLIPSSVHAEWLFTPYLGGNVGGDTVKTQPNFGVSAAWMGKGIVGVEFDAAWARNFFDTGNEAAAPLLSNSRVSTYMVNAIIAAPGADQAKGFRPYASGGLGAIQSKAGSDLGLVDFSKTQLGWNAGAGAIGFMNSTIGIRGDVRFLQALTDATENAADNPIVADAGRFGFWRMTGGVVLRWK